MSEKKVSEETVETKLPFGDVRIEPLRYRVPVGDRWSRWKRKDRRDYGVVIRGED